MKFRIDNMDCGGCARAVTKAVQKLDPEAQVEIDIEARSVEVRSSRTPEDIAGALAAIGYPPAEAA